MKRFMFACVGLFLMVLSYHFAERTAQAQTANTLLAMADYPRSASSAIAVDQFGGVYFGNSGRWKHVATTPTPPADIWSRDASGEVFIAMQNGDLYRLEPDWTLTFDSNVFGGPTPAQGETWGGVKTHYR